MNICYHLFLERVFYMEKIKSRVRITKMALEEGKRRGYRFVNYGDETVVYPALGEFGSDWAGIENIIRAVRQVAGKGTQDKKTYSLEEVPEDIKKLLKDAEKKRLIQRQKDFEDREIGFSTDLTRCGVVYIPKNATHKFLIEECGMRVFD